MQRRNTKQKQLVLDAVRARCDHPTAEQIYQDLAAENHRISRGTVYRNLNALAQDGEILEVEAPTASRFDLRCDGHQHVYCDHCGKIWDAPMPYREELDKEVAQVTGFVITRHDTIFHGLCPDCAKATRP